MIRKRTRKEMMKILDSIDEISRFHKLTENHERELLISIEAKENIEIILKVAKKIPRSWLSQTVKEKIIKLNQIIKNHYYA